MEGKTMKYPAAFVLVFLVTPLQLIHAKPENEAVIESASQFQRWCKSQSYRHFRQKKQQAYNWSASTIRDLNDYQTSGSWKVNNTQIDVLCQIRIGKKAKYTKIEIH